MLKTIVDVVSSYRESYRRKKNLALRIADYYETGYQAGISSRLSPLAASVSSDDYVRFAKSLLDVRSQKNYADLHKTAQVYRSIVFPMSVTQDDLQIHIDLISRLAEQSNCSFSMDQFKKFLVKQ